jgi:cell division protein FtsL
MKKPNIVLTFLILTVIGFSVVQAVMYNTFSTSGVVIDKIEKEISSYKTKNAILSEKLLTVSSLTIIASRAADMGFAEKNSSVILGQSSPLAIKR